MDDVEAQNEELLVLQSIYDEKCFKVESMTPPCGRYLADVQLPDPFYIKLKNENATNTSGANLDCSPLDYEEFQVKYLPPIILYFEYPERYPTDSPPAFLLSCSWLSYDQLSKVCKHLDILWHESMGEVILFQWIQFLKEETLSFLNIEGFLDITELSKYNLKMYLNNGVPSEAQSYCNIGDISDNCCQNSEQKCETERKVKSCVMPTLKPSVSGGSGSRDIRTFLDIADGKVLKNMLIDYNEFKEIEHFKNSYQVCDICFNCKQGSEFVIFRVCKHFFCSDCIKSYFELMITEGNVHSLKCPNDKCDTEADGTVVKQNVSIEMFERYDSLLLARTLDAMSDIAYCPRKDCQCPLLIDVSGRMGSCPSCKFVFCPFCKMTYHGVAPCKFDPSLKQKICDDYLQGDRSMKDFLEKRYGGRTIKFLVEEVLSEKWIGSNSKNCPVCNASIEKTEGCNKMTCFRCGAFFCWLCKARLPAANPYRHYSDRSSECYEKLFPPDYVDEVMFEPGEFLNF